MLLAKDQSLLRQLAGRIETMRGIDQTYLRVHYDMLLELPDDDIHRVLNVYQFFLKINGMSEITAFDATVKMSRTLARK